MLTKDTKPAIDFDDYEPKQELVKYRGQAYILTEASESTAIAYRKSNLSGAKLNFENDKPSNASMGEGMAEAQAILVSGCLFFAVTKTMPDGTQGYDIKRNRHEVGENVPVNTVKAWPSGFVKKVFELAQKMSDLSEKASVVDTRTNHDDESSGEDTEVEGDETSPKVQKPSTATTS